jgi:hypothetical protein
MTPEEYEQWEIDNGLRDEIDRRYIAGLGEDEYQAYLDAGGEPYDPGSETFLGVVQGDSSDKTDTFLGVEQGETESKVQTYLGVAIEPAIMPESEIPMIDFIPPVLTAPELLVYEADNTNGMKPKLKVLVVDNIDEGLVAECIPSKNKVFAIGKHDVECHATDSSENVGYVNFSIEITVRDGVEPISIIPKIQPMPGQGFP